MSGNIDLKSVAKHVTRVPRLGGLLVFENNDNRAERNGHPHSYKSKQMCSGDLRDSRLALLTLFQFPLDEPHLP